MSIKTLSEVLKNPTVLASELLKYTTKAEGVLTSPVVDFIGWEKIPATFRKFSESTIDDLSQFPSDWPEVEIISGQGYIGNFTFPVVDQLLHGRLDQQLATILVSFLFLGLKYLPGQLLELRLAHLSSLRSCSLLHLRTQ